jgi:hypothetical protein
VKYGRAWRIKQRALKLIYGDYVEANECVLVMLRAMKAKNPEIHFVYVLKPNVMRSESRQYFLCAFWTFGQCVEAFKNYFDVLSIDDTFLMGK